MRFSLTFTSIGTRSKGFVANPLVRPIAIASLFFGAIFCVGQPCPIPINTGVEFYPITPAAYPAISTEYFVEYALGPVVTTHATGNFVASEVYISRYGATDASPYETYSQYPRMATSMSFTSIPVPAGKGVTIRITRPGGLSFPPASQVSVRPAHIGVAVDWVDGDTAQVSTTTSSRTFDGEQFILWWDQGVNSVAGGGIQGLVIFLDPVYEEPTGATVLRVTDWSDLADVSGYDTLDFEDTVVLGTSGTAGPEGTTAYVVPANILNVFVGPGAWVQGKLRFQQTGKGATRHLYGPGVIDASRFNYSYRQCRNDAIFHDQGYPTISIVQVSKGTPGDIFHIDGPILSDGNYYGTDMITGGLVNNLKIMSWNGNNDGLEMGDSTVATNVFTRVSDDSLKLWGAGITVKNATVWQNYNGGVVNLGWSNKYKGDGDIINDLHVVKMDWHSPPGPNWDADTYAGDLDSQNNAVIDSMMTPGAAFGSITPPVFSNVFLDDTPRVLLSLKILPPDCGLKGLVTCPTVNWAAQSALNLNLENISTPPPTKLSSIGFQTVDNTEFKGTLEGCMNIGLLNVNVVRPGKPPEKLNSVNASEFIALNPLATGVNLDFTGPVKPCVEPK